MGARAGDQGDLRSGGQCPRCQAIRGRWQYYCTIQFAIDGDDGESEICYCTVRRLHGALLIENVLTVADARGRGLARHLLAHVAAQYPHEDVYLIADNNGYEAPAFSNERAADRLLRALRA